MNSLPWIVLVCLCIILIKSLGNYFNIKRSRKTSVELVEKQFSMETFYTLIMIYIIVLIGFGSIYFILSFQGLILVENGKIDDVNIIGSLVHSFYFSGVTLLTIGYGDITPIGIGRLLAIIEALIGYILPAAFILRIVIQHRNERDY
ncbi:potassium channel family protein [Virgibacillus soli]|uniref:Potassium channel family protein n=1 Tax=Paracerasibacillus soli TaxID=480284 RepID=A0ABU5CMH5_9BACI|nr:potassium channel family protein [Virgibacillus soli]MDY0407563.1 potassium channel family protein [Virgibacillus soli]